MKSNLPGQEFLLHLSGTCCWVKWSPFRSKSRSSHQPAAADMGRLGIPNPHHPMVLQPVHHCGEQCPRDRTQKLTTQHTVTPVTWAQGRVPTSGPPADPTRPDSTAWPGLGAAQQPWCYHGACRAAACSTSYIPTFCL